MVSLFLSHNQLSLYWILRNYKCWKMSDYDHQDLNPCNEWRAASGGVDHSTVTHHDRRDESFRFTYPAYCIIVLDALRLVK